MYARLCFSTSSSGNGGGISSKYYVSPLIRVYQIELSRPERSREHLHHVGSRVQQVGDSVGVEEHAVFADGDVHVSHDDSTQRDHASQTVVDATPILLVVILLVATSLHANVILLSPEGVDRRVLRRDVRSEAT